uniref:Uncharacterized protein n=1 Tax=Corethron hystrix TaxID=216773 RepID=A0A6U5HT95_9STRA
MPRQIKPETSHDIRPVALRHIRRHLPERRDPIGPQISLKSRPSTIASAMRSTISLFSTQPPMSPSTPMARRRSWSMLLDPSSRASTSRLGLPAASSAGRAGLAVVVVRDAGAPVAGSVGSVSTAHSVSSVSKLQALLAAAASSAAPSPSLGPAGAHLRSSSSVSGARTCAGQPK